MAYKFFKIEFNSPQDLSDLKKPIEVFQLFINNVGNNRLRSYNFNKYYDPNNPQNPPRIDIRMNLIFRGNWPVDLRYASTAAI